MSIFELFVKEANKVAKFLLIPLGILYAAAAIVYFCGGHILIGIDCLIWCGILLLAAFPLSNKN